MDSFELLGTIVGEVLGCLFWIIVMIADHVHMVRKNKAGKVYGAGSINAFSWFFPAACTSAGNLLILPVAFVVSFITAGIITEEVNAFVNDSLGLILNSILCAVFALWASSYHIYKNYKHYNLLWFSFFCIMLRVIVGTGTLLINYSDSTVLSPAWGLIVGCICSMIVLCSFLIFYNELAKKIERRIVGESKQTAIIQEKAYEKNTHEIPEVQTVTTATEQENRIPNYTTTPTSQPTNKQSAKTQNPLIVVVLCIAGIALLAVATWIAYIAGFNYGFEVAEAAVKAECEIQVENATETGYDLGYDEGYDDGYSIGYDDGMEDLAEEIMSYYE